ncbi:MAG: regulatory protein RecX [Flavipsychrobacter sp.]|jgi:regulatory protein|nr:regulatory protein RecX [Flavipsychrobacter sp.]
MLEPAILHYCKYQERCHMEVRNKLYELGFSTETVDLQISELIQNGVLNEERFARAFARGKFRMMQWGREKIKQQLKLKKVSDYCIKKGLTEIDSDDYEQTLHKLLNKKYFELRSERSIPKKKSKLYRYLIQKGYERDLVMDAINECMSKNK